MKLGESPPGRRAVRSRRPVTLAENVTQAVQQIICDGQRFQLRGPIDLTVRHSGPYCFVAYTPLAIEGYGRSEEKALRAFADAFSATWDAYASADDPDLTRDARQLKRALRRLVAEVGAA